MTRIDHFLASYSNSNSGCDTAFAVPGDPVLCSDFGTIEHLPVLLSVSIW